MLSVPEQTTIDLLDKPETIRALPTVTYDYDCHVIQATVIISPSGEADGKYSIRPPVIGVLGQGPWTVIWTLVSPDGLSVCFRNNGLIIPRSGGLMPRGLIWDFCTGPLREDQRQVCFTNNVTYANLIMYDLDIDVHDRQKNPLGRPDNLIFDPTIAVVQEPIG